MHPLSPLGWDAAREAAFARVLRRPGEALEPARVIEERRDAYVVAAHDGELAAELPGRAYRDAVRDADLPAVGDFVAVAARRPERRATIRALLPRSSVLLRRAAGRSRRVAHRESDVEVVVANVDAVLVLMSLNADFSPRRTERFLAQIWEGGAQPVVVLTKSDLSAAADERRAATEAVAPGVPVHAISALRGEGLDALAPYLAGGRTAALVGSSGVGKSTLVNALVGRDVQRVLAIREHDDTGVHTTTSRRLFALPSGGCLVDTPGMREFGLWDAEGGLAAAFSDVADAAAGCRFRDCAHAAEPGCAVRAAVEAGTLEAGRLESWRHLGRELRFAASKERKRARALRVRTGRPEAPDDDADA